MRKIIDLVILGLLVLAAIYAYKTPFSFCDTPRTYKIGSIDKRFNIKPETALNDVDLATGKLSGTFGKQLFEYASGSAELTINFVYDARSELDNNINNQQSKLSAAENSLQEKINKYESDLKKFMQKLNEFNATIQKFNAQGGAPPEVYDTLINQQKELNREGEALNARAKELSLETHSFNSNVEDLNQDVTAFNQALTEKPEEGLYDGANKTITIYFVNSKPELIHTLTHEFGHALGMNHVGNPNAIMYPQTSDYVELTNEDKQELYKACKSIPLTEHWIYLLRLKLLDLKILKLKILN